LIWTKVKDFFSPSGIGGSFIKGIPGKIKDMLVGAWNGLLDDLKNVWTNIKNWWNTNVAKTLTFGGQDIPLPPPFPGSVTLPRFSIKIPSFAAGGIVPATRGGMMALIGEGGKDERIEPLDPNGLSRRDKALIDYLSGGTGRGTTINVYPSPGMDERELAQKVSRELAYMMRRGSV
jgi:hypothetical protein